MPKGLSAVASGYLLALAVTAAAIACRWLLDPLLADQQPLVTVYGAVAIAVWFGGYRPALLAALLGYIGCHYLFIPPRGSWSISDWGIFTGLLAFLFSCTIIILLAEAMRHARALALQRREQLRTTLASIGDAVITTDTQGRVDSLNAVAEQLTGWTLAQAQGQPLEEVFHIVNESTRERVENPAARALREGTVVGLANHTVLIARDGTERAIDDSAAPIRDEAGNITGCVLVFRDVAQRRRAEAALEESERRFKALASRAPVGIFQTDTDGNCIFVNEKWCALTGLNSVQAAGRGWLAALHSDDRQRIDREWYEAAQAQREFTSEYRFRTPAGDVAWIRGIAVALGDEDGKLTGYIGTVTDISDTRHAEESRALLGAIVETSDDAIVSKTLEGVIVSWNSGAQRVFGYTPAEAVGQHIELIIPPELRGEEQQILARLRRGERIEHFETVRVTKDGRRIDISLSVSPVRNASGQVIGASKIARDITHRKQAEETVRETENRFRALADSAPVLMWLNDTQGCVFVNRAYLSFLGVQSQVDVAGFDWSQFIHPEDRETYIAAYLDCQRRQADFTAEFRFRRHDGEYRWMQSIAVPRITDGGELLGYTGCTFDMHEPVVVATALRDADRRKDEFLATLAHELRNPLAPLRSALEIMKRAAADPQLVDQARNTMDRQLGQMVRLVDDLLDVSRITRNKLELRKERTELASVIHHAVEICRPLVEEYGHQLNIQMSNEAIYLDADPVRLAQVFGNLLNNACKYTPRGGRIWLTVERQGSDAVVSVRDNGIGIPAEMLPRIFEMFTQVNRTLDRNQVGLGIGLTLVKQLVELHDGRVEATSAGISQGTRLVVRLPIVIEKLVTHFPAPQAAGSAPTVPARRILVVDDNVDSATSLAMLLSLSGHQTQVAHDGIEAVEGARRFLPEVILLDLGLPKLNGFDACRRIRQDPVGQKITIIALTGWGQEEDRRKCQEAGFDAHLVKPVDHPALMEMLGSLPASQD